MSMKMPASSRKPGSIVMMGGDVCKVPAPPAPPIPIPYPNMGNSAQLDDLGSKVKIQNKRTNTKGSKIDPSMGDEAGTLKGLVSNSNMDKVGFEGASSKVKSRGKAVLPHMGSAAHDGAVQEASDSEEPWWAAAAEEARETAAVGAHEDEMDFGDAHEDESSGTQVAPSQTRVQVVN